MSSFTPCNHCLAEPEPVLTLVEKQPIKNHVPHFCPRCNRAPNPKALTKADVRFILQAKLAQEDLPLLRRLWTAKSPHHPGFPTGLL
jgi:hypothetical protein